MRIDLVFPILPPTLNGIGDYTARLGQALAQSGCEVRILTAQEEHDVDSDVEVVQSFGLQPKSKLFSLVDAIRTTPPDYLLVQYEQFAYGRYGFNPLLPPVLGYIKHQVSATRLAVMFHEDFVPMTSWKNTIMTTWQRAQFWALGRLADVVGVSVQPWAERYSSWFPGTEVAHWPVGSNIPRRGRSRDTVREQLPFDGSCVAGVFGALRGSRMIDWICQSAQALQRETTDLTLMYVGPDGSLLKDALPDVDVYNTGPLPAEEVSRHLLAMDLHLAPFIDGASTRRGSFLAGLQHGVPTASTHGSLTDTLLLERNGGPFRLTPVDEPDTYVQMVLDLASNPGLRRSMRSQAEDFYKENFRWDQIADRIRASLASTIPGSAPS